MVDTFRRARTTGTYKSPEYLSEASYSGSVGSDKEEDIMAVAVEVLRAADVMLEARQGWNTAISLPNKKNKGFRIGTYDASIVNP